MTLRPTRLLAVLAGAAPLLLAAAPATAEGPPPEPPLTGWQGVACGTMTRVPLAVARDVDDGGVVVGSDERPRAVSWSSRTGAYRWFGGIDGGRPSEISAVSGAGRVAGWAAIDGPTSDPGKAVRVEGPLPLRPIDRSLRTRDEVVDVNDANVVVGTSEVLGTDGRVEAFVWTGRRHVLPAPDPSYRWLYALAVNEAGWALGTGYQHDEQGEYRNRVVVWRPDRTVVEVPALPDGATFVAEHLDEQGRVIGHRLTAGWVSDAIVTWSPITGYSLEPSPGGDLYVTAADDHGGVIGTVVDPASGSAQPFLFRAEIGFRRLATPDGALVRGTPFRLSEAGQALIQADGRPHLWTPVCPGA